MPKKYLPLEEVSIEELFDGNEQSTYEIPIYQRNYAWEKDEINALVQDVYDAYINLFLFHPIFLNCIYVFVEFRT